MLKSKDGFNMSEELIYNKLLDIEGRISALETTVAAMQSTVDNTVLRLTSKTVLYIIGLFVGVLSAGKVVL